MNGEEANAAYHALGDRYLKDRDKDGLALGILEVDEQVGGLELLASEEFNDACKIRNSLVWDTDRVLEELREIVPYGYRKILKS